MGRRYWLTPAGETALDALIAGRAASRAAGLAVLRPGGRRGRHDPRCAGCYGERTSRTCPYSVKQRRAAQGAGDG